MPNNDFSYESMKARREQKVGVYHGWNVISTSREEYWKRSEEGRTKGAYLIYDDDNALIYMGDYIGKIAANGNIINADKVRAYKDNRLAFGDASPKGEFVYENTLSKEEIEQRRCVSIELNGRTLADEIIDGVFGVEIDDLLYDVSLEGDN